MVGRRSPGEPLRYRRLLAAAPVAMALALVPAACADDQVQESDSPEIRTDIEPAPGAADDVVTQTEDGKDLDENLNVPGTETDEEVDTAFDNEDPYAESGE